MKKEAGTPRNSRKADLKERPTVALDDGKGNLLNAKALGIKDSDAVEAALMDLLEKTRQVGRALQSRREGDPLDYTRLAKLLSEFSTANVYIVDQPGNLLGYTWLPEYESRTLLESLKEGAMPASLTDKMNRYRESVICDEDVFLFDDPSTGRRPEKHLMYVPIYGFLFVV